jgi:hypothetical protein
MARLDGLRRAERGVRGGGEYEGEDGGERNGVDAT